MRYPVDDFKTKWNISAGFGFGDKTDYGSHEAVDINDNLGGNNDLGKPLYAICDGKVTSVHTHTNKPSFGKHLHIKIEGPWGIRWVHYAHCNEILVIEGQQVKEGDTVATIGNSGTVYAHCHLAVKKEPTGVDAIAKTLEDLKQWENPIAFIESWMKSKMEIEKELFEELVGKATTRDEIAKQLALPGDASTDTVVRSLRGLQGTVTSLQSALSGANQEVKNRIEQAGRYKQSGDESAKLLTACLDATGEKDKTNEKMMGQMQGRIAQLEGQVDTVSKEKGRILNELAEATI